jgi:hypothetical protein
MGRTKVDDFMGGVAQQISYPFFQDKPSMVGRNSYAHDAFSFN